MSPTETEADTRANRIDPVLAAAGWGVVPGSRIRREVICPGRLQSGGARGKGLACDYVLEYRGHKLAALEAKRAGLSHREGVGQAKDYAGRLGSRFAYASNGVKWFQCDMTTGAEDDDLSLPFPTPEELWDRTFGDHNEWRERFGAVPFETDGGKWEPRYYQHKAITAALEAVAKGQDRILLTLATGTGKTSIAFQIAWKLFHAKWSLERKPVRRPRILFLADRNFLANQAYTAFSAFPSDAIVQIDPSALRSPRGVPMNASVFFTIFQTFMTGDPDTREHFITQLGELGYDDDRLDDIRQLVDAPKSDLFDVLAYILYTLTPKTRSERAEQVMQGPVEEAKGELKGLLKGILGAYERTGETELAIEKLGQFLISRYGSVYEGKAKLGGLAMVKQAFKRLQAGIYND